MKDLTYGMEGYEVSLLQYALKRAGLDPGALDGIFGRRTAKVLQQFQRERGLAADGIAGKLTWAAVYPFITGYILHRILPGDTYHQLAHTYGTSVAAIHTANPNLDPEVLPVKEEMVVPLDMLVVTAQIPYSGLLTCLILRGLTMRYPFLGYYEIGRSGMGRRIPAISIGRGKKQVGYNAAHHANEWITVPVLLRFAEEYAAAYAADRPIGGVKARELYETATLHMVPLVNPDGVDLVAGALDPSDSFYAQAEALSSHYPDIPFPKGWKSNIFGVDLNLQYPAGWADARRIKFSRGYTRPGPRDYVGSEPLITPENRAMAKWTEQHDFALTLSYHTQGRTIYWKYGNIEVSGAESIGEAMSRSSGYVLERTPYSSSYGGYRDWFIQRWHRPGYTIEAGIGENPLDLSQFEKIYRENLPILIQGITLSF